MTIPYRDDGKDSRLHVATLNRKHFEHLDVELVKF